MATAAPGQRVTVHVAGPVEDGQQRCLGCDVLLCASAPYPRLGVLIGETTDRVEENFVRFGMRRRKLRPGESWCYRLRRR